MPITCFNNFSRPRFAALANPVYMNTGKDNREMDFALERGLCSLLIGELDDCRSWLGLDNDNSPFRDPSIVNFVLEHCKDDKDSDFLPGQRKLLETWLMEAVFPIFRETNDITFKLGDYYDDPTVLRYLESLDGVGGSPLAAAAAIVKIGAEATAVLDSVKFSAIKALQKVFPLVKHGENGEIKSTVGVLENEETRFRPDQNDSTDKLDISGKTNDDERREQVVTE